MNIGKIEIKNSLFLAPMASVTDKPFRTLCKMLGAGLTYTEMVSVKGLYYKSKKTEELLDTSSIEHPCAVQLFGHEPEIFKSVIESGVLNKFDIIDINMGCPAPKIVKNGDGSALMKDLELASKIIKACVSSTNKPITVKFRKGFKKSDDKLIEFAKMCESSGASAITIHPRTREDMFSGHINLEDIKKVKENVNIAVIGNGDVVDFETYKEMSQICDGVMIGRMALKKPEIFLEIISNLERADTSSISFFDYYNKVFKEDNNKNKQNIKSCAYGEVAKSEEAKINNKKSSRLNKLEQGQKCEVNFLQLPTKKQIIKMHLELLKKEYSDEHIVKIFKKYILSYLNGMPNAVSLKKDIVLVDDLKTMEDMIYNFFDLLED